jgi:AraC-like DNA-binding protein
MRVETSAQSTSGLHIYGLPTCGSLSASSVALSSTAFLPTHGRSRTKHWLCRTSSRIHIYWRRCNLFAIKRQRSETPIGTLRSSVENQLQKLLPHGKANRSAVAGAEGMSERTLSRKLAAEGTAYDELVDQLRRSLAFQYIKAPTISVSQIAWLLGYEVATSFNHAFVRWTGRSPSSVRKEEHFPAPALSLQS